MYIHSPGQIAKLNFKTLEYPKHPIIDWVGFINEQRLSVLEICLKNTSIENMN